jgi:hypothetical protein
MVGLDEIITKVHKGVELSAADWDELLLVFESDEDLEISAVDISDGAIEDHYLVSQNDFRGLTVQENKGLADAYCREKYIEEEYNTIQCLKIQGSGEKYIWFARDHYFNEYEYDNSVHSDFNALKQKLESLGLCFIQAFICHKHRIHKLSEEINPSKKYLSSNSGEIISFKDWAK